MNRILLSEAPAKKKLPVGRSKFFGVPDVWEGFEWPAEKGRDDDGEYYLDFLCQINCTEAAPYDTDGVLPKTGIIYFFYNNEYRPNNGDATVFYYDGDIKKLRPYVFEDEEGDEEADDTETENDEDDEDDSLDLTLQEYAIFFGDENRKKKPADYSGTHTLLGWPSDPEQMGLDYEPDGNVAMLIEIDSWVGSDVDFNFGGDCGMLCFFIDKDDLKKKDFSGVWLIASSY